MSPVYDFRCVPAGHLTESRQAMGVESIPCACGQPATRQAVYRFNLGGGIQPKYRVSDYDEARQEANYYHGRMEEQKGETIPKRDLVQEAKRVARSKGAKVR